MQPLLGTLLDAEDGQAERGRTGAPERPAVQDNGELALGHRIVHSNLEQRGMDRVLSYGADGFEHMVNLSVLALK